MQCLNLMDGLPPETGLPLQDITPDASAAPQAWQAGQDVMFLLMNALGQAVVIVSVQHWNSRLNQDRSGIEGPR